MNAETHENKQTPPGSEPEFVIEGHFVSCKNIWQAAFAEEVPPCFAAPLQAGLPSPPHLVAQWPSGLSACPGHLLHCFLGAMGLPLSHSQREKYFSWSAGLCIVREGRRGEKKKRSNIPIYKWDGLCGSSQTTKKLRPDLTTVWRQPINSSVCS